MRALIPAYQKIKQKVMFLINKLSLHPQEKTKGRKLALNNTDAVSLAIFKQSKNIRTKKAIHDIFEPDCSYKTLVTSLNRVASLTLVILKFFFDVNRVYGHPVKHTDSTDVPVCLNKNAKRHQTMKNLAAWGHSGKGWFYGLKLHLTSNLWRKMEAILFTPGNIHGTKAFIQLNRNLEGFFMADAEYISEKLAKEFYELTGNILMAKPRKNMKKLMTAWQDKLYATRMLIELNFRNLKEFYGLVTSLPRSVKGYLANYIHSLLAYVIA